MSHHTNTKNKEKDARLDKKLSLAHHFQNELPQYKDILNFFELVINERGKYKAQLSSTYDLPHIDDPVYYESRFQKGLPLLVKDNIKIDNKIATAHAIKLLNILKSKGSAKISDDLINQQIDFSFKAIFNDFINKDLTSPNDDSLIFLINETLKPVLEIYADTLKDHITPDKWTKGFCPVCGEHPVMSALQNDAGKRMLICPVCGSEWSFQRTQCPFCENQDQQQLSYLYVENDNRYRIELCEKCGQYLKTIDLRKVDDVIDYEIENIVTLHLDIIARDKGYTNNYPEDSSSAVTHFYN